MISLTTRAVLVDPGSIGTKKTIAQTNPHPNWDLRPPSLIALPILSGRNEW